MEQKDLVRELNKIQKQLNDLIKQLNFNQQEMSPFQKAVKIATSKNSSDAEVKQALNTFVESAEQMTINQFAFVIYFLGVNKQHLNEDINWFVGIELGKHKYNQRDAFIDGVIKVIGEKYRSNQTVNEGLRTYLTNLKRK